MHLQKGESTGTPNDLQLLWLENMCELRTSDCTFVFVDSVLSYFCFFMVRSVFRAFEHSCGFLKE